MKGLYQFMPALAGASGGAPSWVQSGAVLDIDFVNDRAYKYPDLVTISSLLTCARTGAGYYTSAAGVLTSVAADTLRYGTNGLLVEGASTNLCLQSNSFTTTWTAGGVGLAQNVDGPLGVGTAWTMTASAGTSSHWIFQGFVTSDPTTHSMYVKAGTASWISLSCVGPPTDGVYFNVSAGTVGTQNGSSTGTIEAVANGWYRVKLKPSGNPGDFMTVTIHTADNQVAGWNAAGTETILISAAQSENLAFATSYIPTTTGSVTRGAETVTALISGFDFNAAAGTIYSQQVAPKVDGTNQFVGFDDGTSNERMINYRSTAAIQRVVTDGGVAQVSDASGSIAINTSFKHAFAYTANDFAWCLDGGTVGTDTSGTLPTVTKLRLGSEPVAGVHWNSYIKRVAYWNTRKLDATLQSLTA